MIRRRGRRDDRTIGLVLPSLLLLAACKATPPTPPTPEITLLLSGQALIKKDPRVAWEDPFGSLRPIIEGADVAFTNFEMAVAPPTKRCGLPQKYEVSLGHPELSEDERPGDVRNPHAVDAVVMEFLAGLGFDLMSLANNHSWDLGDCGIAATKEAADGNGVVHAGTGPDLDSAGAPAYLTVDGVTFALVAATTSHDRRDVIGHAVNGVWTGRQDDWDRNVEVVRLAAARADFVIFYQHFQIDTDEFDELGPGDSTEDGHVWVADVAGWQTRFARAVLDAGASLYIGHGHRAFAGVEIYKGKPLIRQLGGLAYQGLSPNLGNYDEHRPWEGLLAELHIEAGRVTRIEFIPLDLDEGEAYRSEVDDLTFLSRRGLAQMAVGAQADSILTRFEELSAAYGSELHLEGGRAVLTLEPEPHSDP